MKLLLNSQLQHHLTTKVVKESKGHLKPFMPRSYTQQKIKLIRDNFVFLFLTRFSIRLISAWLPMTVFKAPIRLPLSNSDIVTKGFKMSATILCPLSVSLSGSELFYSIQSTNIINTLKNLPHYYFFLHVGNIHIPFKAVILSISGNFYQLQHSQL